MPELLEQRGKKADTKKQALSCHDSIQVKMDSKVHSICGIDLGSQNIVGFKWNLDPSSHEASSYTIVYSDLTNRLFV